VTEKKLLWTR